MTEQLQQHLRAVGTELVSVLGEFLPRLGDDWWDTHVLQQLTYGQQGQVRTRGITKLGQLDVVALLRVFDRNWMDISHVARLPGEVRTMGRQLVDLRHYLAHHPAEAASMPPADTYRHLDTLVRFFTALKGDAVRLALMEQDRLGALTALASRLVPPQVIERQVVVTAPAPPDRGPRPAPKAKPVSEPVPAPAAKPALTLGPFKLFGPGDSMATEITSFSGRAVPATAIPWTAKGPGGLEFLLHVVLIDEDADSEFGQVYCESRLGSPQVFDDIVHRLRVGIRRVPDGLLTMDLRLAERQRGARATKRVVTLPEMDAALGINVAANLRRVGARAVGTRAEVTGDAARTRNWPCITFDANDLVTPAAAYLVTTLMPLMK